MDLTKRKKDLSTNMNHEAAMDNFLGKLGLYRKHIAKDGSCLFRAVAEQVFNCQAEHLRVRKECIEFMKRNKDKFEAFVEGPFDHHLFNLRSEKEWAGQVEIHAISLLYKCDFLVYQAVDDSPIKATDNGYDKKIMLCYSNGNHYDSIYLFDHKKNLAICQSIVFELLYGKVFPQLETQNIAEQSEIPSDNNSVEQSMVNGDFSENGEDDEEGWTKVKSRKQGKTSVKNQKGSSEFHGDHPCVAPPLSPSNSKFHWEVMRSIDPDGYRNIELEVWEETRKEQQLRDETVAVSMQFKKGEKCQVRHPVDDQFYTAVIDDVFEKSCKIWIPELKERKVVPFSNLKPNEHSGNSGYRDLTGYHRKTEYSGETGSRGGNDDQKTGRRRKPGSRRGKGNENYERNHQEGQEDQSGKQKGEKNRRRRNGNQKPKDEKKESRNQGGESGNVSQDQGFFEVSESTSFPALPGNIEPPEVEKEKPEVEDGNNSAAFWSHFQSVSSNDMETFIQPSPKISTDSGDDASTFINDQVSTEKTTEIEVNCVETNPLNETDEKCVSWEDMQDNSVENHPSLPLESKIVDFENINDKKDVENLAFNVEQKPSPIDIFQEYKSIPETAVSLNQNQTCIEVVDDLDNETNEHFEAMEKPEKLDIEEQLSSEFINTEESENQRQETINGVMNDRVPDGVEWINPQLHPDENSATFEKHKENNHQPENTTESKLLQDSVEPRSTPNLHNDIVNGHVTYSKDPEGKDLPKDMEILRYLYNLGVQTYFYYNGMNTAFSGGQPLSPVYPVMSPTGPVYTPMQPYQTQPMLVPQNMCQYPSMQVPSQEENRNQHRQSPGEERRDNIGGPGYKPNVPSHHSPQYHHPQAMSQAQVMYNYAHMYATGHHPVYSNYVSPQRNNYPRYPQNKPTSNRQGNRKQNRYYRNDNQQNMNKIFPVQSGYGSSDSKGSENDHVKLS